ncbi:MAG: DUF2325 domain-containing protein [Ruminococcus sp.]|nr:DUF2325 domain-containing protein [Ruminococcus sp.]
MSVVIIGGNERMSGKYEEICREHGCSAKVLAKTTGPIEKKIGSPDLMILFTSTVSHKMVQGAMKAAKRNNVPVARVTSSSVSALQAFLRERAAAV